MCVWREVFTIGNDEEGCALEEDELIGLADLAQLLQVRLQVAAVGDERVHHLRPRAVEGLVPDARLEAGDLETKRLGQAHQLALALREDLVALLLRDQVHLVHQAEDLGRLRVLPHRLQARVVVLHVLGELAALDVKDIDEDLHVAEDVVALRLEVVLHEGLLPAAVPQVEHQVPKEAHVRVLDVDRRSEPHRVACEVVGEDDRAHRRLAGARLAHQQHLLQHDDLRRSWQQLCKPTLAAAARQRKIRSTAWRRLLGR